jgi:hypothetical protein
MPHITRPYRVTKKGKDRAMIPLLTRKSWNPDWLSVSVETWPALDQLPSHIPRRLGLSNGQNLLPGFHPSRPLGIWDIG